MSARRLLLLAGLLASACDPGWRRVGGDEGAVCNVFSPCLEGLYCHQGLCQDEVPPNVHPGPTVKVPDLAGVEALAADGDFTCALTRDGDVYCWGSHVPDGEGRVVVGEGRRPRKVEGLEPAVALAAGGGEACAVTASGTLRCWPVRDPPEEHWIPVQPHEAPEAGVAHVATGRAHRCVLVKESPDRNGRVACFGFNDAALGAPRDAQGRAFPLAARATLLASGPGHTCAYSTERLLYCWGDNSYGQVGSGAAVVNLAPTVPATFRADLLALGAYHTCAAVRDGGVWCWGGNSEGVVGDGSQYGQRFPSPVGDLCARAMAAGAGHTCVLSCDGTMSCWGSNAYGQLGDGSTNARATPVRSRFTGALRCVAAGARHTCVCTELGEVFCWGDNAAGQLGF